MALLTDNSRGVSNDHNIFIIQATALEKKVVIIFQVEQFKQQQVQPMDVSNPFDDFYCRKQETLTKGQAQRS